ncbi:MAG: hypothetical protein PHI12_01895 [Dehalococcoidales bacterium]|nr:hypothetical protein [Dehalococcoidales bacterium]
MALKDALISLNELQASGIISDYAICGGYACVYYEVGQPTYDLDVLTVSVSKDDIHDIYEYYGKQGAKIENIYIYIKDMPVQFIPNISPLHEEAVARATELLFDDIRGKIVTVEYLIALLLTAYREKDRIRIQRLLDKADRSILLDVVQRFDDGQLYERYKEILA